MIDRYLQKSELALPTDIQQLVNEQVAKMQSSLRNSSDKSDSELFSYPVPELGEGGSCSLFGQVADKPFDLTSVLGKPTEYSRKVLNKLHSVVDYVVDKTKLDWFGIYQTVNPANQEDKRLVKLAYEGAISRSEYPLTEQFAQISNNVQVGLSGESKVINNVSDYIEQGGAYYTCDPKVKAEACLPIYDGNNNVIGIIDAEAFDDNFFDSRCIALLVASCVVISGLLSTLS